MKLKILFFSPHQYFSVHAFPEALLAKSLIQEGNEVVTVNCNGVLHKQCLCMPLTREVTEDERSRICATCRKNRNIINDRFGFRSLILDNFVTEEMKLQAQKLIEGIREEDYLKLNVLGIPVAKYALYEFFLNHKLASTVIPNRLWKQYRNILENAIVTLFAIEAIIKKEMPMRVTTYNSTYSVNRIVCAIADKLEIPNFEILSGNGHAERYQKLIINRGVGNWMFSNVSQYWVEKSKLPLSKTEIEKVTNNIFEQFKAKSPWVYTIRSSNISEMEMRQKIGASMEQKILLATMSSADEVIGLELANVPIPQNRSIFPTQNDWIGWLIEHVRGKPSYFLVVRVHPREYPNKRDKILSRNANLFMEYINKIKIPKNVYINTPNESISLYDLLKITDVHLNRSSSVAIEASIYGIPVLGVLDNLILHDPALHKESDNELEYAENISIAVQTGWKFDNVIKAFRWLNYIETEVEIDISDGFRKHKLWPARIYDIIIRLMRRLGFEALESNAIWQTQKKGKRLKNRKKLCFAICNNELNHIGKFEYSGKKITDTLIEKRELGIQYRKLMLRLATKSDHIFKERIDQCVRQIEHKG